jgi:hypothetical protein
MCLFCWLPKKIRDSRVNDSDDNKIIDESVRQKSENMERIEHARSKLLALEARSFEFFIQELLLHCETRSRTRSSNLFSSRNR